MHYILSCGNIMVYFVISQLIHKISLVSHFYFCYQCCSAYSSIYIYSLALLVTLLHFVKFLF